MDLIIHTFGTLVSCSKGSFVVSTRDGERKTLVPSGISSIQIGKGVQITSDAIFLAIENEIEIILVPRSGQPVGRFWSARYGSVSTIRKGQLLFTHSAEAVDWIKSVVSKKILNQQALLLAFECGTYHLHHEVEKAVSRMEELLLKIKELNGQQVRDVAASLRGWEGVASKIYFSVVSRFLPERYRFTERSQHPALDVANALFNYAYGVLYGKIEGALVLAGIDPYLGVMHRDEYHRPVLVYDVIENYRIWADYVVVSILCQEVITDEYYSVCSDGCVWLESLGRRVLIQSMNDYLDEVVLVSGLSRSRGVHLQLDMQRLAQHFKTLGSQRE